MEAGRGRGGSGWWGKAGRRGRLMAELGRAGLVGELAGARKVREGLEVWAC